MIWVSSSSIVALVNKLWTRFCRDAVVLLLFMAAARLASRAKSSLLLTRSGADQFDMVYAEGLGKLVDANNGRIPPTPLQITNVLLRETRLSG
jgi:hypothetical protein